MSQANIVTFFATAKTQLNQVKTDLATLQADLLLLEQTRIALIREGGNAAAAFLFKEIYQLSQGYVPLTVPGGPGTINVSAPDPAIPRNLTFLGDQRPVSAFDPSLS